MYILFIKHKEGKNAMECCCEKKRTRSEEEKRALVNRLSRIEGQIRGIKQMLLDDKYCVDILTQASAIASAIGSFSKELLESHIRTCVAEGVRNGDDEKIEELIKTIERFIK